MTLTRESLRVLVLMGAGLGLASCLGAGARDSALWACMVACASLSAHCPRAAGLIAFPSFVTGDNS